MTPIKERLLQSNISNNFMDKYNLQPGDVIELVHDFIKGNNTHNNNAGIKK